MHINIQFYRKMYSSLHFLFKDAGYCFHFLLLCFDQKLIMHLKNQSGLQPFFFQALIYPIHRDFDNISGCALNRRIHRHTLSKRSLHKVTGFQFRNRSAASKHCRNIPLFFSIRYKSIKKSFDLWISFKIFFDIFSSFFSCGVDRWPEYAHLTELDTWMYDIMQQNYLWYQYMPGYDEVNLFQDPATFLSKAKWDKDSYSFVDSVLEAPLPTYGFDYSLVKSQDNDTAYNALITYVIPESPAEKAGLQRGDWIMKVDTSYISKKYETQLLQGTIARELSMGVWKEVEEEPEEGEEVPEEPVMVYKVVPNGVTLDLGAAQSIEDQPVHKYKILTLDNGAKVGYLMYNSFTAGTNDDPEKYNNELRKVSTIFQEANVQATILDLRYNEGGSLDCVQLLATILVPNARMGTPMAYLEYNDKNLDKDATINFDQEVLKTGVNLNQNTLVAITSGTTAGAAEMLLTSLYKEDQAPNIIVMGSASKGQTVATEQFINETYRWSVNPVVCTVYNSDHDAGEDAFVLVPSDKFKISETSINGTTDYSQFLPFGNPKERMLSIAIQTLEGTYPPKDEDKEEETRSTKSIKIEKSVSSPASRRFAGGLRIK